MLSRAPSNISPLLATQALNAASTLESRKRLCKSWPSDTRSHLLSEPTSVLDIYSPSPTSTISSSFWGSSSCEVGSLGGSSTSENGAVTVSSLLSEAAAPGAPVYHDALFLDCSGLLGTEGLSIWKNEEDKNDVSATEDDDRFIAAVSKWSADMEMGEDPSSFWGEGEAQSEGISGIVRAGSTSEEESSSMIKDMISGGNVIVMLNAGTSHPSFAEHQQQQHVQGDCRKLKGGNLHNLGQKINPFSCSESSTKKVNGVSGQIEKQQQGSNQQYYQGEVKKEMLESCIVPLKVDPVEMPKMKIVRERDAQSSNCIAASCNQGDGDEHDMMLLQQQQQDQAQRSEEWLPDLQSLPGSEFQAEDAEKAPSSTMDDLESILLTSPPPPDHSLMKLLFGEVGDGTSLQQQLNRSAFGLPQAHGAEQQYRQLDLQEAIEAQFSTSRFGDITPQAVLVTPPSTPSLFQQPPATLFDSNFPISGYFQQNLSSSYIPTSQFNCLSVPVASLAAALDAADQSFLRDISNHVPHIDSSHPLLPPQERFSSTNTGYLPLSYQPSVSPRSLSPGCPSLEKLIFVPAKLPHISFFTSNLQCNSLPTYSVPPSTRIQKVMIDNFSNPHYPFQAARPSVPFFSGYMQHKQQNCFHGPQDKELLPKSIPSQPKPEPGCQVSMTKYVEDSFSCVVRQGMQQQVQSLQERDGSLFPRNSPDFQLPALHRLSQCIHSGKVSEDEVQLTMVNQLLKAAEAVELGNISMAQAILARLNHQLSPQGKPLQRAAFHFKEALRKRVAGSAASSSPPLNKSNNGDSSPLDILNRISAYKSFCEFSLLPQFAHFSANQAILEAMEGEDSIHVIDFDLGFGGQWASFLQEIAMRPRGPPKLRITTVGAESIEMQLTRENLYQFAKSLNTSLDFQLISVGALDGLTASTLQIGEKDAVAVNFAFGLNSVLTSFSPNSFARFFQLVKDFSPKVVTVVEMESECNGSSFLKQFIDSLEFYASLFGSLDSTNLSMDIILMIEKLIFAPRISSLVGGTRNAEASKWHSLLSGVGFSPIPFSPIAERQADCLIQNPQSCNRGFNVSKCQGSLLLGWQGRTLVSACVWS